jgi:hypothetical protein
MALAPGTPMVADSAVRRELLERAEITLRLALVETSALCGGTIMLSEHELFHPEPERSALTLRVKVALYALRDRQGVMVLLVGWRLIAGT